MQPEAEDVARYLKANPEFFEQYAEMLAEIFVPHPHGGRAIPISERQIVTLREKNRALEDKLRELVQFGQENDSIIDRLHRITLAMMMAGTASESNWVTKTIKMRTKAIENARERNSWA